MSTWTSGFRIWNCLRCTKKADAEKMVVKIGKATPTCATAVEYNEN